MEPRRGPGRPPYVETDLGRMVRAVAGVHLAFWLALIVAVVVGGLCVIPLGLYALAQASRPAGGGIEWPPTPVVPTPTPAGGAPWALPVAFLLVRPPRRWGAAGDGARRRPGGRRAGWPLLVGGVAALVALLVARLGLPGAVGIASPTSNPAGPDEQRRLVGLVAPAIRAALAGEPLPPELGAEVEADLRNLLVAHDATGAEVERVTAFRPDPLAWERADTAWTRADPAYRAAWRAPLRGELTVRERGAPAPLTYRYLGGEAELVVRLAREGDRWRVLAVGGNLR